MFYTMQCGCKFKIKESTTANIDYYKNNNIRPPIIIDWENLPNCSLVWKMLGEGYTKGVFQLESGLGRSYAKKLKPESIEHLSALGSILRPGCLEDKDSSGISTTEHYCLRKNNLEPVTYPHESLKEALEVSYGLNIYQEQALKIAEIIAGFNLGEADNLRRGIGKKLPEVIAKCKIQFLEGAKKVGLVSEDKAKEIFSGIEASQRYSFNKCLSPNTTVESDSGLKTIDELQIGEKILCPNYESGYDEFNEVVNKYENGNKDLYDVTTESGKVIECSMDHKLLCEDGQVRPLFEVLNQNLKVCCKYGIEKIVSVKNCRHVRSVDLEINSKSHIFYGNEIGVSNSHSFSYALNGYYSAFMKIHFPIEFFCSYLVNSDEKQKPFEEIAELASEAKFFGINIVSPSIKSLKQHFHIVDEKTIRYGIIDIKSIGKSHFNKLVELDNLAKAMYNKELSDLEWNQFLPLSTRLNKTLVENLIQSGALSCLR